MIKSDISKLMTLDDDFMNDLAADWYFLTLHFNAGGFSKTDPFVDELIDCGIALKRHLRNGSFTYLTPMNVFVDRDTFFDIWLDADGDIQVCELYTDEFC